MKKKALSILLCASLLLATLAGCKGSTEPSAADPGSTPIDQTSAAGAGESQPATTHGAPTDRDSVIIAIDQEAEPTAGFDPTMGWGAGEHTHESIFQSKLLKINDDITIGNDLATEYFISDDGLAWTFKLRPDVKFSDGEPLTAADVAFTYMTAKGNVTETDLTMIESVEAVDDTTVVFHLNKPFSPLAYLVSVIGIVPEHAYDPATYGQNPIGSGPYVLKQWDKGEQVIYEANPDYYGEAPGIKRVTVVFMSEEAAYAAAQSGQVDVAYTSPSFTLNPIEGYKIVEFESVDGRAITMPVQPAGSTTKTIAAGEEIESGNAVTSSKAFRQAVSYAIDREAIASEVFYGYAKPAYSNAPGMPWENEASIIEYDPEKAKSLLEADGWIMGSDGIYEKDGQAAEFSLTCMAESTRADVAMAVTEMLKEVGIRVNNQGGMSWDEIDPTTYTLPNVTGTGQLTPGGMVSRAYTGKNRPSYSNLAVDGHIDDALAATSMEDSYEHWRLAQWDGTDGTITDADCPWIYVVTINHIYFAREDLNVVDNKLHPHGYGWVICNNTGAWSWN